MSTTTSPMLTSTAPSLPQRIVDSSQALSYWERALDSLSPAVRQLVDFGQPDKQKIIEDVLQLAEDRKQQCVRARWRISRSNGEVIVLRDVFEKVITFAHKFREIGDVAVQYDPVHASLPWAGVRLLLQVVINDSSAFAAMMEGMEQAASCISRYAIIEELYLREWSTAADHLAASLIKLYASILIFLGKSIKFFGDGTAKRVLKNSLGMTDKVIAELVHDITDKQLLVERDAMLVQGVRQLGLVDITGLLSAKIQNLNLDAVVDRMDISEATAVSERLRARADTGKLLQLALDLNRPLHRVAASLEDLKDGRDFAERVAILKWVSSIPYAQHHNNVRKDRIVDTGKWLFQNPIFQQWQMSSSSSILWLHGIPGSGKTVLTSALIDELLLQKKHSPQLPPVAYFYCSRNSAEVERSVPVEVLSSISRQLSGHDATLSVRRPTIDKFRDVQGKGFDERRMDITEVIELIIALNDENPAVIVIDALDECDPETRHELLEELNNILTRSSNVVKLFVTSRDDHDIVCRLENIPNVYISAADNGADIRAFVRTEVTQAIHRKRLLHGNVSADLETAIINTLNDGAQGMFRWVSLQIQNLCNPQRMKIEADVVSELGKLPTTLSALYDVIYDQIENSGIVSKVLAERALQWMLVAQRPLRPTELVIGVMESHIGPSINLKPQDLLNLTANLLVIDKFLNTVRFAHVSVRDYLECRAEFVRDKNNMQVALACLRDYQLASSHQPLPGHHALGEPASLATRMLRPYSCQYWPVHVSQIKDLSCRNTVIEILKTAILDQITGSSSFRRWRSYVEKYHDAPDSLQRDLQASTTVFRTCCLFGLWEILDLYSSDDVRHHNIGTTLSTEPSIYSGFSPFHMTVFQGHYRAAETLLLKGTSATNATLLGESPIYLAVRMQQSHMISLLKQFGANVDVTHRIVRPPPSTDMSFKDPKTGHNYYGLAPFRPRSATRMGNRDSNGRPTSALDEETEAPIHLAAAHGHMACVKELLCSGADINIRNSIGATPLVKAWEAGKHEILEVLLQHGADANVTMLHGRTVMHLAAASGDAKAITILVRSGADSSLVDWLGSTASQIARRYKHDSVVNLLPDDPDPETHPRGSLQQRLEHIEEEEASLFALGPDRTNLPRLVVSEWNRAVSNLGPDARF